MRGLDEFLPESTRTSVLRSSRNACATGTAASWLRALASPDRWNEKKRRNGRSRECFCFGLEKTAFWQLEETIEVNETGLVGSRRFHCAKRGPKRTPTYSLIQFRLGFELQPPPLSGTTLAERLPLRIPGIHDYALLSATESSKHTDVIMVVVLRSRDAVSLRLASLAWLAAKNLSRPASSARVHMPRYPFHSAELSCLIRIKSLCAITLRTLTLDGMA